MLVPFRSFIPASLFALFLVASAPTAQQPAGEVMAYTKISRLRGGPPQPPLRISDQFGRGCGAIGDLDGDGVPDMIVGAHGIDDGADEAGFVPDPSIPGDAANIGGVFVCLMKPDGGLKRLTKISATAGGFTGELDPKDGFGRAAAGIGDFDRDGIPDVAVGANSDDDGGNNRGAVWLLYLKRDGTVRTHQKISSTQGGFTGDLDNGDEFGRSIALLGDLDGDGVEDLAVGAANDDDGSNSAGAVWILFMRRDGTVKGHQKISMTQGGFTPRLSPNHSFGMSVAALGDIDGDGVGDLASGAIGDPTGGPQTGAVFVMLLRPDGTVKSTQTINARNGGLARGVLSPTDEFGFGATGLGDLDGDGVGDLAVGAILDDDGDADPSTNHGAVYILFLRPDGTVKSHQKISNNEGNFTPPPLRRGDWWGTSLANLGDLNGDGTPELAAGARFDDEGGAAMGAVYVLFLSNGGLQPPVARFGSSATSGPAPWTVSFDDQTIGAVSTRTWDFGDGNTSSSPIPVHTYATPGTYDVSLSITNPAGTDTLSRPGYVRVTAAPPVAGFAAVPRTGKAPLSVDFSDASTGLINRWDWTFGDGATAQGQGVTHVYTDPGTYTASLRVTGPGGSDVAVDPQPIVVLPAGPSVAFSNDPAVGASPLGVQFTDASSATVSTWLWDFGDGATSTATDPFHTYSSGGTYDVSLTVRDDEGSSTLLRAGAVIVDPPAPSTSFQLTPLQGSAPLTVTFADQSTGLVSSWSWDFGDGGSSILPSGTHVYQAPGSYVVSLRTTGPGGSDVAVGGTPVVVDAAPLGLVDGGFELQTRNQAPADPWTKTAGDWVFVHPMNLSTDLDFPSEGSQWLEVNAMGTDGATGPSNPGGWTSPPTGGAGVLQDFRVSPDQPVLVFDAAFLRNGPASSTSTNDWMSVDVSDGSQWWNLYYADSFTAAPLRSAIYGVPRTATTRVEQDLTEVFGSIDSQTLYTLSVQVGNGGNDRQPSSGFVDAFALQEAGEPEPPDPPTTDPFVRYGCGVNPVGSLEVRDGSPQLGDQIVFEIDNPLGTMAPGAASTLSISLSADAAYPCGGPLPGWGMDPATGQGELLIVLTRPDLVQRIVGTPWGGPGTPGVATLPIPTNANLAGTTLFVQGALIDGSGTGAVPRGLTDALTFVLVP